MHRPDNASGLAATELVPPIQFNSVVDIIMHNVDNASVWSIERPDALQTFQLYEQSCVCWYPLQTEYKARKESPFRTTAASELCIPQQALSARNHFQFPNNFAEVEKSQVAGTWLGSVAEALALGNGSNKPGFGGFIIRIPKMFPQTSRPSSLPQ